MVGLKGSQKEHHFEGSSFSDGVMGIVAVIKRIPLCFNLPPTGSSHLAVETSRFGL